MGLIYSEFTALCTYATCVCASVARVVRALCSCAADAHDLHAGVKRLKDADRLRIGRDVDNGALLTACAHNHHVTYFTS